MFKAWTYRIVVLRLLYFRTVLWNGSDKSYDFHKIIIKYVLLQIIKWFCETKPSIFNGCLKVFQMYAVTLLTHILAIGNWPWWGFHIQLFFSLNDRCTIVCSTTFSILIFIIYILSLFTYKIIAAVGFDPRSQQTWEVKISSDSSTAKRSATGVGVSGLRR